MGGRKGQNRIPQEAFDGYITEWRHANTPPAPDKTDHGDGYHHPPGLRPDETNPLWGLRRQFSRISRLPIWKRTWIRPLMQLTTGPGWKPTRVRRGGGPGVTTPVGGSCGLATRYCQCPARVYRFGRTEVPNKKGAPGMEYFQRRAYWAYERWEFPGPFARTGTH